MQNRDPIRTLYYTKDKEMKLAKLEKITVNKEELLQ